MRRLYRLVTCFTCVVTVLHSGVRAADFLRGDANGDERVTFADTWEIYSYLFRVFPDKAPPTCIESFDVNDSSAVDVLDLASCVGYLLGFTRTLPLPFPAPGPDPLIGVAPTLPCDAYGGGSTLSDPQAKFEILSAHAPGGLDAEAQIVMALTNSRTAAGFGGRLRQELLADREGTLVRRVDRIIGPENEGQGQAQRPFVDFFYSISHQDLAPFLPSDSRQVIQISVCLEPGTTAGEYALSFENAEIIDMDTARSIIPETIDGVLVVESDVASDANCVQEATNHNRWGFPVPSDPVTKFRIPSSLANNGDAIEIPVFAHSTGAIRGLVMSLAFDSAHVRVLELQSDLEVSEESFRHLDFSNEDEYIIAAMALGVGAPIELTAHTDHEVLRAVVDVDSEDDAEFTTSLRFVDGAPAPWGVARNEVIVSGQRFRTDSSIPLDLVDGAIVVNSDGVAFRRGTVNADDRVDLSDAVAILGFLFLGDATPQCLDALDVDDDGRIVLTDAVALLSYLFLGGAFPASPGPARCGPDMTADELDCVTGC